MPETQHHDCSDHVHTFNFKCRTNARKVKTCSKVEVSTKGQHVKLFYKIRPAPKIMKFRKPGRFEKREAARLSQTNHDTFSLSDLTANFQQILFMNVNLTVDLDVTLAWLSRSHLETVPGEPEFFLSVIVHTGGGCVFIVEPRWVYAIFVLSDSVVDCATLDD